MVQPTANTELTIAFIRILETVMCLLCLIAHINTLSDEEPMPHIVLFCGTFGGFFILSLAKLFVPISGQLSPPGVDLIFCFLGFILFYCAACAAMFYVQRDPHLIARNGTAANIDEEAHPFFQRGVRHAILSMSTGTLFLMHTVISADRLASILKGIEEDVEREIDENDVDIYPEDTISLHLFFLNWVILIWNTACCKSIRKLIKRCQMCCIQYYRKKRSPSYIPKRRTHRRAKLLETTELKRLNGIRVVDVAPQEFIRNPRRSIAHNNFLALVENENTFNRPIFVDDDETPQQGPSSQPDETQMEKKRKKKTVVWEVNENSLTGNRESDEWPIIFSERNRTKTLSLENNEIETNTSFTRNEEFGSDEDIPQRLKKISKNNYTTQLFNKVPSLRQKRNMSFIRNEAFGNDENVSRISKIKKIIKNPFKTADNALSSRSSSLRSIHFIRNEAFGSDEDVSKKISRQTKESLDFDTDSKSLRNRRQITFTRNKEFGSEGGSKLRKFLNWFPKKAESVVQTVDKETIRAMETFVSKSIDSRANSEVEISTFGYGGTSMDANVLQRKTSSAQLQPPLIENQEDLQSTIFESSFVVSKPHPCTDYILCKKEPKNTLQNKEQENENDTILPAPETISNNIQIPEIIASNKEATKAISESLVKNTQAPSLPIFNLIPYILTKTINKDLEITLDNEIARTQQTLDSTSFMKEVAGLIPSNKITESTETQSTDYEYRCIFPALDSSAYMKEVASLIPTIRISESSSKNVTTKETEKQATFPVLDSSSYMKEVASLIPSIRISESSSKNVTTKETEKQATFPVLDSSSYMKEVASLIPSIRLAESTSKNDTEETECRCIFPVLDSTSYMKEVTSLIPANKISESTSKTETKELDYQTTFPELDSASYLQTIAGLIPPNRNTENLTSSGNKEKKKESSTDDIETNK